MDKHLKERLVGAAVLVVAANILIPPMLTGPHENAPAQTELLPAGAPTESGGVKTYTIDLSAAQRKDPSTATDESANARAELPTVEVAPAPPPDEPVASRDSPATQSTAASREPIRSVESSAPVATPSSSSPGTLTRPATSSTRSPAAVSESRTSEPTKVQVANDPAAKVDGTWAVQVASFGARATADRIAGELKSKGFKSYVTPFEAKGQTLYRVRVGPVEDRAAADALLKRVRALHPSATVVTQ